MTNIIRLIHREKLDMNHTQLKTMYLQLGSVYAEREINQTLEDLAARLVRIKKAANSTELRRHAHGIMSPAHKLGLTALEHVAHNVAFLADRNDPVGLNANLARLERLCEDSTVAIWRIQDMSI